MDKRERVIRAIEFRQPDRVPVWQFNRDHRDGDLLACNLALGEADGTSEWGYRWIHLDDGTMGQPDEPVLPDFSDLDTYRPPELHAERRLANISDYLEESEGYYRLAGLGISGFTTYTFVRGFENAVTDFALEPEASGRLLDMIFGLEKQQIELSAEAGCDGVHFSDDWGTQDGLIISPAQWRATFKERYRDQFDLAHRLGLHVWFHCCGAIFDIVEDFYEIGVDVMNISQPNVVDMERVGASLRGKQCFLLPISYQTVSISGTPDEIHEEARRLHRLTGTEAGGLIGYVEEYGCMGMSEANYQACIEAFREL